MSEAAKKNRPQFGAMRFADVGKYRLPLAGVVSFLHRVSGALLFVLLPFVLYMLDTSLLSEISFEYFKGVVSHWFVKLILLALCWAYLQHFCAGVRHLVMDLHIGLDKDGARKSAVSVLVLSSVLTAAVALKLFGVF